MYGDYKGLVAEGVGVFSVKTGAFTIKSSDLEQAQACLNFGNDIGGWRCSKCDDSNTQLIFISTSITAK
jgi:hypothetical protein